MTPEERKRVAARALPLVDLTDLNEGCNHDDIDRLCKRAQTPHGNVAAICIWPRYVAHVHKQLSGTDIPIATVVNFPGGNQSVDMTVAETRAAIADGAAEIDLVMPYGAFRDGDTETAREMIDAVRSACGSTILLKVIIEAGELSDIKLIAAANDLAISAKADFTKTSTGKTNVSATLTSAEIMLTGIKESQTHTGFKPAGGIKTTEDCAGYLALADRIMGDDWVSPRTFRFGASSVLDDLLAALDGKEGGAGEGY